MVAAIRRHTPFFVVGPSEVRPRISVELHLVPKVPPLIWLALRPLRDHFSAVCVRGRSLVACTNAGAPPTGPDPRPHCRNGADRGGRLAHPTSPLRAQWRPRLPIFCGQGCRPGVMGRSREGGSKPTMGAGSSLPRVLWPIKSTRGAGARNSWLVVLGGGVGAWPEDFVGATAPGAEGA